MSESTNKYNDSLLSDNLDYLIKMSGVTQIELCSITAIPPSTLSNILTGSSDNPRLSTLKKIARTFNINVSQLIGELPLNFFEVSIPILDWKNLDNNGNIDFVIGHDTKYISTSLHSKNKAFALEIQEPISDIYKLKSLVIFEIIPILNNNCDTLISIRNSAPVIKKIILESDKIYLKSVSHDLPLEEAKAEEIKIFGVVREIRFP